MKKKDILKMLDQEIDSVTPKMPNDNITKTPIKVKSDKEMAKAPAPKKNFLKTRAFQVMCACLVCVAVLVGIVVPVAMSNNGGASDFSGSTYLSMSINPSVDFVLDNKGNVKNIISRNMDGDVLLSHGFKESLVGKKVDDAIYMTLDKATQLGYIDAVSNPAIDGNAKLNALKISVASDSDKVAQEVLDHVKTSATSFLKAEGILMVVGGRQIDKDTFLNGTGISSIDKLSESIKDNNGLHFVESIKGKSDEDIAKIFKEDFISEYVDEIFDEIIEDVEDMLDYIEDIYELEAELEVLDDDYRPAHKLSRDYWKYLTLIKDGNDVPDNIREVVDRITDKINEYNSELIKDKDSLVDVNKMFDPIEKEADLNKMKVVYKAYYSEYITGKTGQEYIEKIVEDVKEDIGKLEDALDKISAVIGEFKKVSADITNMIGSALNKVSMTVDEYLDICKSNIDKTHDTLLKRHENNKSNISADEYDKIMQDILEDFDEEDFWK